PAQVPPVVAPSALCRVVGRSRREPMTDVFHHLLPDIGIAIIMATVFGLVAHWLRQPIILGYLLAGALVGPQVGFGLIRGGETIEIISEIGLVLLLFIIGLEMNVNAILKAGRSL